MEAAASVQANAVVEDTSEAQPADARVSRRRIAVVLATDSQDVAEQATSAAFAQRFAVALDPSEVHLTTCMPGNVPHCGCAMTSRCPKREREPDWCPGRFGMQYAVSLFLLKHTG
jgi:hypothetical protein